MLCCERDRGIEMITRKAQKELLEWLRFCKEIGWREKQMPGLTDIWWRWHGDDGQLLAVERQPVSEECEHG